MSMYAEKEETFIQNWHTERARQLTSFENFSKPQITARQNTLATGDG